MIYYVKKLYNAAKLVALFHLVNSTSISRNTLFISILTLYRNNNNNNRTGKETIVIIFHRMSILILSIYHQ